MENKSLLKEYIDFTTPKDGQRGSEVELLEGSNSNVSKKEMKDIFKKHGLDLGFPNNATSGRNVTDWALHYHSYKKDEESDLEKFKKIIVKEYPQYETSTSMMMSSVTVTRKEVKESEDLEEGTHTTMGVFTYKEDEKGKDIFKIERTKYNEYNFKTTGSVVMTLAEIKKLGEWINSLK